MSFPFVRSSTFAGAMTVPFVLLLAACATQPKPPAGSRRAAAAAVTLPRVMPVEAEPKAPATQPASLFTLMTQGPLAAMLSYADKVRSLGGGDLGAEISRIGDPGDSPTTQMQLALLLSQTRVPADLARALGLLQRVHRQPVARGPAAAAAGARPGRALRGAAPRGRRPRQAGAAAARQPAPHRPAERPHRSPARHRAQLRAARQHGAGGSPRGPPNGTKPSP
jgi:hypothetical protein